MSLVFNCFWKHKTSLYFAILICSQAISETRNKSLTNMIYKFSLAEMPCVWYVLNSVSNFSWSVNKEIMMTLIHLNIRKPEGDWIITCLFKNYTSVFNKNPITLGLEWSVTVNFQNQTFNLRNLSIVCYWCRKYQRVNFWDVFVLIGLWLLGRNWPEIDLTVHWLERSRFWKFSHQRSTIRILGAISLELLDNLTLLW